MEIKEPLRRLCPSIKDPSFSSFSEWFGMRRMHQTYRKKPLSRPFGISAASIADQISRRGFTELPSTYAKTISGMYRIAINVCKNHFRDDPRRREVTMEGVVFADEENPLDHIISKEERIGLSLALNELPEKQRHTVMLRVYQGLKYREIAAITGCSEGTAKANFHFGVKKLREILKD
jgi:RNA polymerase sigma factor (sigma-70 family)